MSPYSHYVPTVFLSKSVTPPASAGRRRARHRDLRQGPHRFLHAAGDGGGHLAPTQSLGQPWSSTGAPERICICSMYIYIYIYLFMHTRKTTDINSLYIYIYICVCLCSPPRTYLCQFSGQDFPGLKNSRFPDFQNSNTPGLQSSMSEEIHNSRTPDLQS